MQQGKFGVKSPGNSRVDWHILKALAESLDINISYNTLKELRQKLVENSPHFSENKYTKTFIIPNNFKKVEKSLLTNKPFDSIVTNFYMTDPISKSSSIMALCTNRFLTKTTNFLKE